VTSSLLLFGFLLGMKHALEADHVAAVASLATRSASLRDHVTLASLWGIGHALTILAVGSAVVGLGLAVPASLSESLDGVVGLMLIALGADVLRRLRRKHVHFHVHSHDGGARHFHAHAHAPATVHDPAHHQHSHVEELAPRALMVGSLHGLAGSAALVLLSFGATRSAVQAFAYLALFGLGSIAGMVSLSFAIAVPLRLSAGRLARFQRALEGTLGTVTIALGCWMTIQVLAVRIVQVEAPLTMP
jgi:hypothetical protein